jgi:dGTPase
MTTSARKALWGKLLSTSRLFHASDDSPTKGRSEFERDHDRVIFASAFRRLKDKTQVFPLSPSDYTRTRLTHSLEASCVGRSLGDAAARILAREGVLDELQDVPTLVATACLAHDIGNPPFGHSGEDAIKLWALRRGGDLKLAPAELRDIQEFEGNAQGFRIMTRLQNRLRRGGIRPTLALLGAMTKYPRSSSPVRLPDEKRASEKKFGFFQDDVESADEMFQSLGMVRRAERMFARHPLAFLTEAADDICYVVMDLEDALKLKIVSFDDARHFLAKLCRRPGEAREPFRESSEISRLRAYAVNDLIEECARVFEANLGEIERGEFDRPLIKDTEFAKPYGELKAFEKDHVYTDERALEIEYAGFHTIGGLLDMFCEAVLAESPTPAEEKLLKLLPSDTFDRPGAKCRREELTPYQRVLAVTDHVSGMTDSYAVELYQKLSGIRLPV